MTRTRLSAKCIFCGGGESISKHLRYFDEVKMEFACESCLVDFLVDRCKELEQQLFQQKEVN